MSAPAIPSGWRRLRPGSTLAAGDRYQVFGGRVWTPIENLSFPSVGDVLQSSQWPAIRRKKKPKK